MDILSFSISLFLYLYLSRRPYRRYLLSPGAKLLQDFIVSALFARRSSESSRGAFFLFLPQLSTTCSSSFSVIVSLRAMSLLKPKRFDFGAFCGRPEASDAQGAVERSARRGSSANVSISRIVRAMLGSWDDAAGESEMIRFVFLRVVLGFLSNF